LEMRAAGLEQNWSSRLTFPLTIRDKFMVNSNQNGGDKKLSEGVLRSND
jgi:hypothetical protein